MEPTVPGRGVTVLIVEDDRRIRRAMRLLFATIAGSVGQVTSANGADALRLAAELDPGVALVDVSASDRAAGLPVLRTLADAGWQVVALSAQGGLETAALQNGAAAFLDTGADPDEIVALVRRLVERQQGGRSHATDATD